MDKKVNAFVTLKDDSTVVGKFTFNNEETTSSCNGLEATINDLLEKAKSKALELDIFISYDLAKKAIDANSLMPEVRYLVNRYEMVAELGKLGLLPNSNEGQLDSINFVIGVLNSMLPK